MEPYGIFFLATSSISTRYSYYFAAHEKQIRTHMRHYLGGWIDAFDKLRSNNKPPLYAVNIINL